MEELHSQHDARILSQRHSLRNNNSLRHPKDKSPKPRNIEILNPGKSKINPPKRRNSRSIFRRPLENASKFPSHSSLYFNILSLHEAHSRIEIMIEKSFISLIGLKKRIVKHFSPDQTISVSVEFLEGFLQFFPVNTVPNQGV